MEYFVVAEFLLTSSSRTPSAIAETLVLFVIFLADFRFLILSKCASYSQMMQLLHCLFLFKVFCTHGHYASHWSHLSSKSQFLCFYFILLVVLIICIYLTYLSSLPDVFHHIFSYRISSDINTRLLLEQ